jgi:hypothetical protein
MSSIFCAVLVSNPKSISSAPRPIVPSTNLTAPERTPAPAETKAFVSSSFS